MSGPKIVLSTGSNAPLGTEEIVRVKITWEHAPVELDVSCFMVDQDGKIPPYVRLQTSRSWTWLQRRPETACRGS